MKIHPYWKEKIKEKLGKLGYHSSPSRAFKSFGLLFGYGLNLGMMSAKLDKIDYKNQKVGMGKIHLPENRFEKAKREFEWMKREYD